jgi:O-antigen/teichoic acid export membrane protein
MIESANLKGVAAKGLFWSAIERFGGQGIQFVFGILVTRILSPSDYGLLGMVLIFMAVGQTLADSGFGSALIWKKSPTAADYSTVFYFNITVSIVLYFAFYLLAPIISGFYSEPKLTDLIRVICLNFILLSFGLIQQTVLQKKVDFRLLAYINIASSLVGGFTALFMAMRGFGVWALVWQILIKSLVTSGLLWVLNKWRPVLKFSWLSLKELFGYGSKLTGAGLIYTIFQYFYYNVIGKLFPVEALGFYTRAAQLQEFPVKTIGSVFQRVAFPVFATIQDENERLRNAVGKTLRTMAFINFPILIGLIAVADNLIVVLLTEKWLPASNYFKLLCLIGLFYSFHVVFGEILKTKGKSKWILNLEFVSKTIMIINIFVTWRWGIIAIILGQLVTVIITHLLDSYYIRKSVGYSLLQQFKDVFVYFAISVLMYFFAVTIAHFIINPVVSLIVTSIAGAAFYIFAAFIAKVDEVQEIKKIFGKVI